MFYSVIAGVSGCSLLPVLALTHTVMHSVNSCVVILLECDIINSLWFANSETESSSNSLLSVLSENTIDYLSCVILKEESTESGGCVQCDIHKQPREGRRIRVKGTFFFVQTAAQMHLNPLCTPLPPIQLGRSDDRHNWFFFMGYISKHLYHNNSVLASIELFLKNHECIWWIAWKGRY